MWPWNWKKEKAELNMHIDCLVEKQKADLQTIIELEKQLEEVGEADDFEYKPGRPPLIIKLGDKEAKWIPSRKHFAIVHKYVKDAGLDKRFNILIYHYGIEFMAPGDPDFDKTIRILKVLEKKK